MNNVACQNFNSKFDTNYPAKFGRNKLGNRQKPSKKWQYKPKSIIDCSLAFSETEWKKEKNIITISAEFREKYEKAKERITFLCQDQTDEDAPNNIVEKIALQTLNLLRDNKVLPSLINATGDKSLIFEFFAEDNFFLIEFYNSGEIIYLRRIAEQPKFVAEISFVKLNKVVQEIARSYANVIM